jgi:5'(3')-deoxyribonucleotidase
MRKSIMVDMDGVLADVYARFFEIHEQETGQRLTLKDIAGKLEAEAFANQRQWVTAPGFFRYLPIMEGSREVLLKLSEHYRIIVVSLATEFPNALTDKQLWLNENFPFIGWKNTVFCGDKSIIEADIMIDDHFKNLDFFDGETLMFTQPPNMLVTDSRHRRVDSWKEIEKLLLP